MAKIRGIIIVETTKALKLKITEDERSKFIGETKWFPKTQIRLDETEISIMIPDWFYNSKPKEQE